MSDVKCPYCGCEQEINHDDGYGYGEGGEYEQWCDSCEKVFNFETSISIDYTVFCADHEEHELEFRFGEVEGKPFVVESCTRCDYEKYKWNF